jgi:hypothetical protein
MEYFKLKIIRFASLFALVLFVASLGPSKIEGLPSWGRWGIVFYVLLSIALPALLFPWSRLEPATSRYALAIQSHARMIWRVLFWFYICTFVGGLFAVVILRPVIPFLYAVLPLGVNLIFILLFWRLLSSSRTRARPR